MKIVNTKSVIFLLIMLFIVSCNGQEKSKKGEKRTLKKTEKKIKIMKKLDAKKFATYKSSDQLKFIEKDTFFSLEDQGKTYQEIKNKVGENFKKVNVYDKEKLILTFEGNRFFNFPIGTNKGYDLNGNIIYEKNFDDDFPFSISDLRTKIMTEFGADINVFNNQLIVNRGHDSSINKYCYDVSIYANDGSNYRFIVVDGVTGEILKNTIYKTGE